MAGSVHPDSEQYLKTWYDTAMNTEWKSPNEVKQTYGNAKKNINYANGGF